MEISKTKTYIAEAVQKATTLPAIDVTQDEPMDAEMRQNIRQMLGLDNTTAWTASSTLASSWVSTTHQTAISRLFRRLIFIDFVSVAGVAFHKNNLYKVPTSEFKFNNTDGEIVIRGKYRVPIANVQACRVLLTQYDWLMIRLEFGENVDFSLMFRPY
jgi:hypothetical protein